MNNFPTVNYISLRESIDRQNFMDSQLSLYGFSKVNRYITERFTDIEKNLILSGNHLESAKHQIGSTISMLNAIRNWYLTCDEECAIFCEDDISFETINYWTFTWEEFVKNLPQDWDIIQLTRLYTDVFDYSMESFKLNTMIGRWWGATCLIRRPYAKYLLDKFCVGNYSYDFNVFIGGVDYMPIIENVLYLSGRCYNIPLLFENCNLESTYKKDRDNKTYMEHKISSEAMAKEWRTNGLNTQLSDLLKIV